MNSASSQNPRVLIVEDEMAAREASERYLSNQGFDVRSASNASEALRKAEDFRPNVLVCDWNLGDRSSGTDVARKIQKRQGIPVIFVTAHPLAKLREVTRDISVTRYLQKPFRLSTLTDAIIRSMG